MGEAWAVLNGWCLCISGKECGGPAKEGSSILRGHPLPCSTAQHPTPFLHPHCCPEPALTQSASPSAPPGTPGQGPQQARLPGTKGPRWNFAPDNHLSPRGMGPQCGAGEEPVFIAIISRSQGAFCSMSTVLTFLLARQPLLYLTHSQERRRVFSFFLWRISNINKGNQCKSFYAP